MKTERTMKDFYIMYWTIGASKASCGVEPVTIRFHCKAEMSNELLTFFSIDIQIWILEILFQFNVKYKETNYENLRT